MFAIAVYQENAQVGRIVSTRVEITAVADLMESGANTAVHVVFRDDDISEEEQLGAQPFFVIERGRMDGSLYGKSSPTVQRLYSLHDSVVEHLSSQEDHSLVEDSELLRFAISCCGMDAGVNPFTTYFQKIRPLEVENALLRSALGFKKRDVVDFVSVKKKLAARHHTTTTKTRASDDTTGASTEEVSQARHNLQSSAPTTDPFSIHAPHLWEMETDAAINARTRYNPQRTHSPSGRRLDLVTQQHLVVRLHDKSVDLLRSRRSGKGRDVDHTEKRCLSPDEQIELGARLHDRQREHTKKVLTELESKFHPNTSPKRVLTADELKASTDHVYTQPLEKKRNNLEKLIQKYVYDEDEKKSKLKLTLEQQKAMGERLSSKS